MYAYPDNVMEEVGVLLTAIRVPATAVNPKSVQAAWAVLGFGLKLGVGTVTPLGQRAAASPAPPNQAEMEAKLVELQAALNARGAGPAAAEANDSIASILTILLPLIVNLLNHWLQ